MKLSSRDEENAQGKEMTLQQTKEQRSRVCFKLNRMENIQVGLWLPNEEQARSIRPRQESGPFSALIDLNGPPWPFLLPHVCVCVCVCHSLEMNYWTNKQATRVERFQSCVCVSEDLVEFLLLLWAHLPGEKGNLKVATPERRLCV